MQHTPESTERTARWSLPGMPGVRRSGSPVRRQYLSKQNAPRGSVVV